MFKPITVEAELIARTARFDVEGVVESRVEPIKNPLTGSIMHAKVSFRRVRVGGGGAREQPGPHRWPRPSRSPGRAARPYGAALNRPARVGCALASLR